MTGPDKSKVSRWMIAEVIFVIAALTIIGDAAVRSSPGGRVETTFMLRAVCANGSRQRQAVKEPDHPASMARAFAPPAHDMGTFGGTRCSTATMALGDDAN